MKRSLTCMHAVCVCPFCIQLSSKLFIHLCCWEKGSVNQREGVSKSRSECKALWFTLLPGCIRLILPVTWFSSLAGGSVGQAARQDVYGLWATAIRLAPALTPPTAHCRSVFVSRQQGCTPCKHQQCVCVEYLEFHVTALSSNCSKPLPLAIALNPAIRSWLLQVKYTAKLFLWCSGCVGATGGIRYVFSGMSSVASNFSC